MAAETDSDSMAPKWRWRPAVKFDIGSVARFADEYDDEWTYGLLLEIREIVVRDLDGEEIRYDDVYQSNVRVVSFDKCEIQYDANKEPRNDII
jgi:hypothetical protein